MKPKPPKTRNSGQWTEARFNSFIKSALRSASNRWGPKHLCMKNARVGYGKYECCSCRKIVGPKQIKVDHINPVVSTERGFNGWGEYIARMFVEVDGFQAICKDCHQAKTNSEREQRKINKSSQ
jgi:5-methylcytosine-specific restriction endonuclease McrA